MNNGLRRMLAIAASATLLGSSAVVMTTPDEAAAVTPPVASTKILCEQATSGGGNYDGPSASDPYDRRFSPGPMVSAEELDTHTPQGVVYWENWNRKGDDLLLISAHDEDGKHAHVIGLDPTKPRRTVGTVEIGETHAGGLAINKSWLFVDGPKAGKWHTIRKYGLDDLRRAMLAGNASLTSEGKDRKVYGASFMTVDGNHLYSGKWLKKGRTWMYRYTIGADGSLKLDRKPDGHGLRWEVPFSTQGVAKVGNKFLFSSSTGRDKRSNLYVTNASQTNLDKASPRCFRAPSMSQGVTVTDSGRVYLNFESGSHEFDGRNGPRAKNVIPGTHVAKISTLTDLPGGKLYLGKVHSKKQEDFLGDDEIAIKVEGKQISKTININEGERKKIKQTFQFSGNAKVQIWERDSPDADDYLGKRTLSPGSDEGILSFKRDGAHYRVSYKTK